MDEVIDIILLFPRLIFIKYSNLSCRCSYIKLVSCWVSTRIRKYATEVSVALLTNIYILVVEIHAFL